jgi:aerobic-type carbon monoxide dehydrogenase small subunit (CoxS/CutS family)
MPAAKAAKNPVDETAMTDKIDLTLSVNGELHAIRVEPRKTLVDALREDCGLTGTHIGCEHGVCGACTIIISNEAVRSCLMFAVQAVGKKIRTVEGLARDGALHPLQRAFIAHHGLQCGFCTPGFLMLATNMLEQNPNIGEEEMLDVLSSNLCRCTGYQNIVKAVKAAQAEMRPAPRAPAAPPPSGEGVPAAAWAAPQLLEQAETAHD